MAICLFCSFAGSDSVYYFQSSLSCGRVSMCCTVICHVVTLRGFPGLVGDSVSAFLHVSFDCFPLYPHLHINYLSPFM